MYIDVDIVITKHHVILLSVVEVCDLTFFLFLVLFSFK